MMRGRRLEPAAPALVDFLAEALATREIETLRDVGRDVVASVAGASVVPLQADVCRITFPDEPGGTPAHRDDWYVAGPDFWIAWMALVDCPVSLGPLEVAGGRTCSSASNHAAPSAPPIPDHYWQSLTCREGDIVVIRGDTFHRSRPNRSADNVRLSVDFRYAVQCLADDRRIG
ncbi:MAG: phytanoyl-CoA dioxygenase family protein [Pseudomonadota bacterium]